jgi:hypothetical protein
MTANSKIYPVTSLALKTLSNVATKLISNLPDLDKIETKNVLYFYPQKCVPKIDC